MFFHMGEEMWKSRPLHAFPYLWEYVEKTQIREIKYWQKQENKTAKKENRLSYDARGSWGDFCLTLLAEKVSISCSWREILAVNDTDWN